MAFWTLVLWILPLHPGSAYPTRLPVEGENLVITPECAWPLGVNEQDVLTACTDTFYTVTPNNVRGY